MIGIIIFSLRRKIGIEERKKGKVLVGVERNEEKGR